MTSAAVAPLFATMAKVCFFDTRTRDSSETRQPFVTPACSINQAALNFTPPTAGYLGQADGMPTAMASLTIGLVKNDPALRLSASATSSTMPLAARSANTADLTAPGAATPPTSTASAVASSP